MPALRCLIVDDEPLARKRLRRLLREHGEVEIVGECRNGREAVDSIKSHRPDLVFLDIQMPGGDGFDVVDRVGLEHMPRVIFVTAHSVHAVRAFEVDALDYLLKPYDAERLKKAIQKARSSPVPHDNDRAEALLRLLQSVERTRGESSYMRRLLVRNRGRAILARVEMVDWIEAAGKYVPLHCGDDVHLLRQGISELAKSLDPSKFQRIHRSTIVNLDSVREFQPTFHGQLHAILRDGNPLVVSRRYRSRLQSGIKSPN